MSLDAPERPRVRPALRPPARPLRRRSPRARRPLVTGGREMPSRSLLVALVLACAVLATLDSRGAADPARALVGSVLGPVETTVAGVVRPIAAVPRWFEGHDELRQEIDDLEAQNAKLRAQVRTSAVDRNRLAEVKGLTATAEQLGFALVPARVVGIGPSQSFSDTVTIDAGSEAGLRPDMTVVNNDGLVGRILRVTATTATVLLVIDRESTVGGRVGESMKLGFLHGRGEVGGDDGVLDLELIDQSVVPAKHDTVVTWGSDAGGPYVADVPVGEVQSVYTSLRESSQRVVIEPYVDFGALDLVGVVVPSGSSSDRSVIEADGSIR